MTRQSGGARRCWCSRHLGAMTRPTGRIRVSQARLGQYRHTRAKALGAAGQGAPLVDCETSPQRPTARRRSEEPPHPGETCDVELEALGELLGGESVHVATGAPSLEGSNLLCRQPHSSEVTPSRTPETRPQRRFATAELPRHDCPRPRQGSPGLPFASRFPCWRGPQTEPIVSGSRKGRPRVLRDH